MDLIRQLEDGCNRVNEIGSQINDLQRERRDVKTGMIKACVAEKAYEFLTIDIGAIRRIRRVASR